MHRFGQRPTPSAIWNNSKNKTPETIGGFTLKRLADVGEFRQSVIRRPPMRFPCEMLHFPAALSQIKHPTSQRDVSLQSKFFKDSLPVPGNRLEAGA